MHHEYESDLARSSNPAAIHARSIEPGRSSRSASLHRPGHPLRSGLVQRKANQEPETDEVHRHAAEGISGPGSALPFLDQIQRSFGSHDVSGIVAHVGGPAAGACEQMAANAYATGTHVAFRGTPDLHTAAHEAAHVVQQRAGVQLSGGVGQVGDEYERHADQVADAVVAGRSAESLLGASGPSEPAAGQSTAGGFQMRSDDSADHATCPKCQRRDCECSGSRGNSGVQHASAHDVQRAPSPPGGGPEIDHANPSFPDPFPKVRGCVLIVIPGDRFSPLLKCPNLLPGNNDIPDFPVRPGLIPDFVQDKLNKAQRKADKTGKPQFVAVNSDDVFRIMCALNPVLCGHKKPQDKPQDNPPANPPLGFHLKLDTVRVLFKQGRPRVGDDPGHAIASDGLQQLSGVIARLTADRQLNVHLIGNSSMEGAADVNLAVSTRRVDLVFRVLTDAGRALQVFTPPLTVDSAASGCNLVGVGQFSCGELHADEGAIDPGDRNVLITFFRFQEHQRKPVPTFGFPLESTPP